MVVLRAMLVKLLNRDLDARRAALRTEKTDVVAQLDDLDRRAHRVKDHGEQVLRQMRAQHEALNDQLLSDARAGDEESLSRVIAWMETADQRQRDLNARFDALMAEVEVIGAEVNLLAQNQTRIEEDFEAIAATQTRRLVRLAQVGLISQFVTAAIGLIPFGHAWATSAHAIHLEYYAAVAGIAPVLLIAGFVEIAILAYRPAATWSVLTFTVPAIGAGAAALVVLATHDSTSYTRFLTIWGLVATLVSLILYVVGHATLPARD